MNYLIDTHILLWAIFDPEKIPKFIRGVLEAGENVIFVSAVSFWEISLKYSIGKIHFTGLQPEELPQIALGMGFKILDLEVGESSSVNLSPIDDHRDPYDRMLIWQAIKRKMVFVSVEKYLQKYKKSGPKYLG